MRGTLSPKYNLKVINPSLSHEWHPTMNGNLTPTDVTPHANKKVWWRCRKGHEWKAQVNNRSNGNSCPYCRGRYPDRTTALKTVNPVLANEWHPTKNYSLTPEDVTSGSSRKVWWRCCKGHEWIASIKSRNKGRYCPVCKGRVVHKDNCLQTINPNLAKQWYSPKNGGLTPRDVTVGSKKKVWWQCSKNHIWRSNICDRSRGVGCPFCTGKRSCVTNSLLTINPILAKEWHPTKNGRLTPRDVTPGSNKKVWWKCKKDHIWRASIYDRNRGRRCPYCHSQTSVIELRIYAELKRIFREIAHRKKIYGFECDIALTGLKFVIEVDGLYWHKHKARKIHDRKKTDFLSNKGIFVLRVRERGLSKISKVDIYFKGQDANFELISKILNCITKYANLSISQHNRIKIYLKRRKIANNSEFLQLLEMLPSPFPEYSLAAINKLVAKEWHPTRNGNLTPKDVTVGSGRKVWWRCRKGHEWETDINSRNKGHGCPFCAGKLPTHTTCLLTVNPILAKEWDSKRNGLLTPKDVTSGSSRKVWWQCHKGHEWQAKVEDRNRGNGCPYCSGRRK